MEAVAGDRGVLGGILGSISSFVFPTNTTIVVRFRSGVSRLELPGVFRRSRQPDDLRGRRTGSHGSRVGEESSCEDLDLVITLLPTTESAQRATSASESCKLV